jgi:adhesin transport system membrane fusion protein
MSVPGKSLHRKDLPRLSMFLIAASTLAVTGFIAWASWAEIDQITRAPGQVIASSRNQLVQAPEGGVLQDLLVKEGALVRKGQPLANFEKTRAESSFLEAEGKVAALRAAVARLRAEVLGGQPAYPAELARFPEIRAGQQQLFVKRRAAFYEEIAALERSLGLVREELDMNLPLLKTGDVSKAEVLTLQR